jgi:hypothetical protein
MIFPNHSGTIVIRNAGVAVFSQKKILFNIYYHRKLSMLKRASEKNGMKKFGIK